PTQEGQPCSFILCQRCGLKNLVPVQKPTAQPTLNDAQVRQIRRDAITQVIAWLLRHAPNPETAPDKVWQRLKILDFALALEREVKKPKMLTLATELGVESSYISREVKACNAELELDSVNNQNSKPDCG